MKYSEEIVAWQPVLTEHQIYTLEALQEASNFTVIVYASELEDTRRVAQGWTAPNTSASRLDFRLIPRRYSLLHIIRRLRAHRKSIHIFGSPFDKLQLMAGLLYALFMGAEVYLISEPYSPIAAGYFSDNNATMRGLKSRLRPWLYKLYGLVLRRRISGIFAISPLAIEQFRDIGVPKNRIFPFGYFVPRIVPLSAGRRSGQEEGGCLLRAVCVANLIERKGIPELIAAVAELQSRNTAIHVDFYGAGDPSRFAFRAPTSIYRGVIPFGQTQQFLAQYNLLILPSKYDGWGVVVNEALAAGVPVLCSDRVGAAAVVRKWKCGSVYDLSGNGALETALSRLAAHPTELRQMSRNAADACVALQPAIAAKYMIDVLLRESEQAHLPACPWYEFK